MSNRGSEWRKWDLHIHTPASFYWTGTKKYKEMSKEEINAEIKNFIKIINESDVAVFCLMDYWTFDWYLELQDYLIKNPDELKKTVLPGMELRVESPTSYRLNIHFILSDKLSRQQLIDFKSELYIRSINKKLSDDSLIQLAKSLDASKAKHHSFEDPKTLDDDKLLLLGSQTAEITKESLHDAFKQIPSASGFVFLPYDTSDGLLELDWKKYPHADNYFMQTADIFESRDQTNIDLIGGKLTEENKAFFENFFKTLGSKPKPCVAGSDAHKYSDYGKFPSKKATWIKADPTFEGLKQIIFEPTQRVRIQENEPDFKEDKLVIDEVRFITSDDRFTPLPIKLNKNLNVIVGGKSSGKSILLYNIAKTLHPDIIFFKNENIENKYDFREYDDSFNFEIKTKGNISQLMFRDSSENSVLPDIKYLPQNYLIKLAEPEVNKKGRALNKVIRDLIIEDENSFYQYEDVFIQTVKAHDKERERIIDSYFNIKDSITDLEKTLKVKNNKDVLEQNIKRNSEKITELNKSIGLNDSQIKQYELLQKDLEAINLEIEKIRNDYKKIVKFNFESEKVLSELKRQKDIIQLSLENPELKAEFESQYVKLDDLINSINNFIISYETTQDDNGKTLFKNDNLFRQLLSHKIKEKEAKEKELEPLNKNKVTEKIIKTLEESINEDKKSLNAIIQLNKEIKEYERALAEEKTKLFDLYQETFNQYLSVLHNLRPRVEDLKKDQLDIKGLEKFNFSKFRNYMLEISHGGSKSYMEFDICDESKKALDDFDVQILMKDLKDMFFKIENDEYKLLKNITKPHAIKVLLNDYFFDYWEIEYKGDKLGKMSSGKASFVILMLIIGLSKSKAPILIDQPEDNLDNRSVSKDLVDYLKNKKLERQIILVTHNPNIVVNADAENIIIANQIGQNDTKSSSPYQFDYINGALENSFVKIETEEDLLKSMGIREHIADIVEGGREAFKKREEKYGF
ncbi:TrlF family AAA-like ATPase [Flavobacterium sp. KACC 22761]|uniref:TrlF family AAA-like ATPase n=1 Tax=Flavobacterium sp. KACC 22761 TaxID=3092665 RepID=UPI002A757D51|nr:hypothetical protein [Flavobacterium sp. KACC 22761]WPO78826.1 hypothetical protein SCB73_00230 [Flavobacterium sp. KACC 22761]